MERSYTNVQQIVKWRFIMGNSNLERGGKCYHWMENSARAKVTLFILTFFVIGVFKYCMFVQSPNVLIFDFFLNFLFSVLLFLSQRYCYDFITDYFFKNRNCQLSVNHDCKRKQWTTIFTAFCQIMLRE